MAYSRFAFLRGSLAYLLALSFGGCVATAEPAQQALGQTRADNAIVPVTATLAAGPSWSCAIAADHKVDCWGETLGVDAQLPDDEFTQIATGSAISRIACGIKRDGTLSCWGNTFRIGDLMQSTSRFTQVVIGQDIICGLTTERRAECSHVYGATQVEPPASEFVQLTAGGFHACGLHPDGTAECWGSPASDENPADHGQTTPPSGQFVQLTAGVFHTCGLRPEGKVECWGLGRGEPSTSLDVRQALPPEDVEMSAIVAGGFHTCGIRADNAQAVCWGAPRDGAPGPADFGQSTPPAGARFASLAAGFGHTCGLTTDGEIVCWGDNVHHQCDAPHGSFPLPQSHHD